jgi:hypothetical protein
MLSVTVPSALLAADPVVHVKALMLDEDGLPDGLHRTFNLFPENIEPEKLVYLTQDQDNATYLLFGRDLEQIELVWPALSNALQLLPGSAGTNAPRLLKLPVAMAGSASNIVLRRALPASHPFLVPLAAPPKLDASSAAALTAPAPKFQDSIMVGADEASIVGPKLDAIVSVLFGGQKLKIGEQTPTSIKLQGLAAAKVSAVPKTQEITLVPKSGPSTQIPLEVVTGKVEVIQK